MRRAYIGLKPLLLGLATMLLEAEPRERRLRQAELGEQPCMHRRCLHVYMLHRDAMGCDGAHYEDGLASDLVCGALPWMYVSPICRSV